MSKEIKVLHISKNMGIGGVEQFIMNQYRELANQNIQFDICVYGNEEDSFEEEITSLGGKILKHPLPNRNWFKFKKEFIQTLRIGNYDVVHCHQNFFSGMILPIARKEKVPIRIAHSHTSSDMKAGGISRPLYRKAMRQRIIKSATHLLAPSKDSAKFLFGRKVNDLDKVTLFPNAIILEPFLQKYNSESLKRELRLPHDATLLGHVGVFKPSKNQLFLLHVFKAILQKNKNIFLILVGDGPDREKVIKLINELELKEKVILLGFRKDIPRFFSSLNLFLFPSLYEGLGITLIESQAAGLNSVISDKIPLEADLGLGLVQRASITSIDDWANQIEKQLQNKKDVPVDIREKALQDAGYDSFKSAKKMLMMYKDRSKEFNS